MELFLSWICKVYDRVFWYFFDELINIKILGYNFNSCGGLGYIKRELMVRLNFVSVIFLMFVMFYFLLFVWFLFVIYLFFDLYVKG